MQKVIVTISILVSALNSFSESNLQKITFDESSSSIILLATPLKHKKLIYNILDPLNRHKLTNQEILEASVILKQISKDLDSIQPMFSFGVE